MTYEEFSALFDEQRARSIKSNGDYLNGRQKEEFILNEMGHLSVKNAEEFIDKKNAEWKEHEEEYLLFFMTQIAREDYVTLEILREWESKLPDLYAKYTLDPLRPKQRQIPSLVLKNFKPEQFVKTESGGWKRVE